MNTGKTIFSQLMDFLPLHEFRKCVERYKGNYKVQKFSCYSQFLCMAFAQLTYRESLRDIEACLGSMKNKLYHMGICHKISRSTLADANEKRNWRIYANFAQALMHTAKELYVNEQFCIDLKNMVYALEFRARVPGKFRKFRAQVPGTEHLTPFLLRPWPLWF